MQRNTGTDREKEKEKDGEEQKRITYVHIYIIYLCPYIYIMHLTLVFKLNERRLFLCVFLTMVILNESLHMPTVHVNKSF